MMMSDSATNGKMGPEWVHVEGGQFNMGGAFGNRWESDALPVHSVTLRNFYVSKYEVTQKLYESVMGRNPSDFKGDDNLPVESVSWYDAVIFCNALSKRDGLTPCYTIDGKVVTCHFTANGYRLGTEAEWEYAARGGYKHQGHRCSGSPIDYVHDVAWYEYNSGHKTHPAGMKAPNEIGLYDMSGNVSEWCWDWYDPYSNFPQANPEGPPGGSKRVHRGGCWQDTNRDLSVTHRGYVVPDQKDHRLGFRLFRTGG